MKTFNYIVVLFALAVGFAACSKEGASEDSLSVSRKDIQKSECASTDGLKHIYVSESLAEFLETKAGGDAAKYAEGLKTLGFSSAERLFPAAGRFEERTRAEGLHRWYLVSTVSTKANCLEEIEEVEIVDEEVSLVPMGNVYNDPYLPMQTGVTCAQKGLNAMAVWETIPESRSDVIVAVVDGGINSNHDDLQNILVDNSFNFVSNRKAHTADNHGTAMAGIIAANCNNGKGLCGVADNVKVLGCQIFETDATGNTTFGYSARAIKYAADNGAVICNNSWGYNYASDDAAAEGAIRASDKAAIDYFIKYAGMDENGKQEGPMAGGLVIFSAGNSGFSHGWPAEYSNVLAIGAFDAEGNRASISNYGAWVNLCANVNYISTLSSGYGTFEGTSASCAAVSGAAALIVSRFGGEGFTADKLKSALLSGAKSISGSGIGRRCDVIGAIETL